MAEDVAQITVPHFNGNKYTFDRNLAKAVYDTAVVWAPRDTGNLSQSIRIAVASKKLIRIRYSAYHAFYTGILEKGLGKGRGKQHKGFISQKTRMAMVDDIISYYSTGGQGIVSGYDKNIQGFRDMTFAEMYGGKSPRDIRSQGNAFTENTRIRRRASHAFYRRMIND